MTESLLWQLRNQVDTRLGLPVISPEDILGHHPPPGPPVLFEDLEDGQGVPLFNPVLRGEKDEALGNWHKIAQLRLRNAEVAIPQAIHDGSATNIVVPITPDEFAGRFAFEPDLPWTHRMRRIWHLNGILAGGVDGGMGAARNLEALAIQDEEIRRNLKDREGLVSDAFGLPTELSQVRDTLAHVYDLVQRGDVSELQRMYRQHPDVFLTYIVGELSSFWDKENISQNLSRLRKQGDVLRMVVGASLDEPSSQALTPVFNNAMTLYLDRLFAETYPATFALANQASGARLPVDYYMRFSHPYLWQLYKRYVVDSGLVNEAVFAAHGANVYGNVRGTYALGLEAAQKESFRKQLARISGIEIPAGQEGAQQMFATMDELAASAHDEKLPQLRRREIANLRLAFVNAIRRQYDLIRCRLDVEDPKDFNRAVNRVREIIGSSSGSRRLLDRAMRGFTPEVYARISRYSYAKGPNRMKIPLLSTTDPFRLLRDAVMALSEDELAYVAVHYHGPLGQNVVNRNDGISTHDFWGEVQITPSSLRPMNTVLQPIFAKADRRLSEEMRESYAELLRDTKVNITNLL